MPDETAKQVLYNISDEETLKSNLAFAAFFIALYENFISLTIDRIRSFLCEGIHFTDSGEVEYQPSSSYELGITKRKNEEGKTIGALLASMLWFVDNNAITKSDYELFLRIREQRNKFAHELTDYLLHGYNETEIKAFFDLFSLYKKIDKWWINEIEIPCADDDIPQDYDPDGVQSVISGLFDIMTSVIFLGKSDEYKAIMQQYPDLTK